MHVPSASSWRTLAPLFCASLLVPLASALHGVDGDENEPRPGAEGIGDPYFPKLGNGGYDVQHYHIDLDVDMETNVVEAVTDVRAVALHALSSFNLDLHHLEVSSITVDGEPAKFEQQGRELIVTPAQAIENGAEFVARIEYGGVPEPAPDASHPFRPGSGWSRMATGVYVMSECTGAASWFPSNDHPRDKATFSFEITVPKPYTAAANGILDAEEDHGDTRTFAFSAKHPMAPYLATVNIAEFTVEVREGPRGMPLRMYYPVDSTEGELAQFARQNEIIEFFETCFGPYPFESVGAIISYENLGGALETQTIPVYGRGMPETVVAHELAHQWFGDVVTNDTWPDLWLNEGFATYAAILWDEYAHGFEVADGKLRQMYRMLRGAKVAPPIDPGVGVLFGPSAYQRGAWVLHNLREQVGDDIFFDICMTWTEEHAHGTASTADLLELIERKTGTDPEELIGGVLRDPVIPEHPLYEDDQP